MVVSLCDLLRGLVVVGPMGGLLTQYRYRIPFISRIKYILNAVILAFLGGPDLLKWVRSRDYRGVAKMEGKIIF